MYDDDNRYEDEEEESLIKREAKKAISKNIKTMPLRTKLIIAGIILGIVLFLLIFVVLVSTLSMMFFFNDDENNNVTSSNLAYIDSNSEDNFWLPIGSEQTETRNGVLYATGTPAYVYITSPFGHRTMVDCDEYGNCSPKAVYHSGVDMSGPNSSYYVIAASKGFVLYVNNTCDNNGYYRNRCGGTYGNYVVIEHAGGVYTTYAHLAPDSITVNVGDTVNQGQVIAMMGNSGSSTGMHLHFQVGIGNWQYSVDPLDYISFDNPRPITIQSGANDGGSSLLSMLQGFEGTGPTDGDSYVVYADSGGVLTVGHGVTLTNHSTRFESRGISVSNLSKGSKISKDIVDDIELEIVNEMRSSVVSLLDNNDISLKDYQIDALVIRMYNVGNVNKFPSNYNLYGDTEALYDNYMSSPVTDIKGTYLEGLAIRRAAEWKLFHTGVYTFR